MKARVLHLAVGAASFAFVVGVAGAVSAEPNYGRGNQGYHSEHDNGCDGCGAALLGVHLLGHLLAPPPVYPRPYYYYPPYYPYRPYYAYPPVRYVAT